MRMFFPTPHLREKLEAREITWAEIVDVLENPEVAFGPDAKGRMTVQKDNLCVVVGRDGGVVTVLLRQQNQWTDEEMKKRKHHGR